MTVFFPFLRFLIFCADFLTMIVFIQVIFSWLVFFGLLNLNQRTTRQIAEVLHKITNPFYQKIYKILPAAGGVDFAPLVLWLGLTLLKRILWEIIIAL